MAFPTYLAATTGQPPLAQQVNALLVTHPTTYVYSGAVLQSSQTTAGTGSTSSNGLWMAQSFTTGSSQTTIGYIDVDLQAPAVTGALLGPITIGIYANSGGAPTGSALVSTVVPVEYVTSYGTYTPVPMPVAGLSPSTTYWIVTQPAGNSTYSYPWPHSNQASGASTSTNGTSWTAQSYGLLYKVYDNTAIGAVAFMWADAGTRWQTLTRVGVASPTEIQEYALAQGAGQYMYSGRALAYSGTSWASAA